MNFVDGCGLEAIDEHVDKHFKIYGILRSIWYGY